MKAGWSCRPISAFAKTSAGGTPNKSNKAFYDGGEIPWLLSGEVGRRRIVEARNCISEAGLKGSSAKLFPPKSVLIAMYGATAGEVGVLEFETSTNQAVCAVLPSEHHDSDFLYYYLLHAKAELVSQAVGNAQPNISQAKIKTLPVPLPPLEEQQRIVAILDEAFEGLARAKVNAEANLASAKELFDTVLSETFSHLEANAPRKSLADAALDFGRGRSRHRPRNAPELYGGDYPFVQTGDVRQSNGKIETFNQTYNESGLAQSKLWPTGTVCITIAANIAETAVLSFDACFPDSVIGMVCDPEITSPEYVELMLRYFAAGLKEQGKGSAQDNINLGTFERSSFPFPSASEQASVVSTLLALSAQVRTLQVQYEAQHERLTELRQSVLAKAFAGELT